MKHVSTNFLRGFVFLLGVVVIGLCIFVLPIGIVSKADAVYRPLLLGLYVTAIPFFIALYQALQLLNFIDHDLAFSKFSVSALKVIKYCAIAIGIGFAAALPYAFAIGNRHAPGVMAVDSVVVFCSMVFAVFAAVLQKLLQDGLEIKSENDLTV